MQGRTTKRGKAQGTHGSLSWTLAVLVAGWSAVSRAAAAEPSSATPAALLLPAPDCSKDLWRGSALTSDWGGLREAKRDLGDQGPMIESLAQPQPWDRPVQLSIAPDEAPLPAARTNTQDWQFIVAPYLWAAGMDGDVSLRGRSISLNASFIDVLEDSDSIIGIEGYVEIRKGRLGAYVDGTYLKLGVDDVLPDPLHASLTNELALVDFGVIYRLGSWDLPGQRQAGAYVPALAFDAIAGGRYTYIGMDLDFQRGPSLDRSDNWVYPLVGGRMVFDLTRNLQLLVRGDIGGFGVDDADFAWSGTGLLGYKFKLFGADTTAYLGYRALDQDLNHGSGPDQFGFDVLMHGPIIGIAFRF